MDGDGDSGLGMVWWGESQDGGRSRLEDSFVNPPSSSVSQVGRTWAHGRANVDGGAPWWRGAVAGITQHKWQAFIYQIQCALIYQ